MSKAKPVTVRDVLDLLQRLRELGIIKPTTYNLRSPWERLPRRDWSAK